jgi:uncharacterized protein (TIGR02246 family)
MTAHAVDPVVIEPSDASPDVVEELTARVADLERFQRTEDVEGFLALFTDDAVWVNGAGRRLVGLEEIAAFTRTALPGAFVEGSVDYVVRYVKVVRPDVALTGVAQQYVDADGAPAGAGSPSYLWVRGDDGTWRITVGQNTPVAA